jgi:urease accessory protein
MTGSLARVVTERAARRDGRASTRLRELRSGWPVMLKPTLAASSDLVASWAGDGAVAPTVHLTAGGAGPVGGDRRRLEVVVGAGSALVLGEVSPTLLLGGPTGAESTIEVDLRVAAGGTLAWLPELVIAADGCRHRTHTCVALDPGARLLLREEVLFGRYGEQPGAVRQRLRVTLGGRPVHDQELAAGPGATGWNGPAVTASKGCAGSLLVVDPGGRDALPAAGEGAAVMALPGPGFLLGALAEDTTTLRRRLDAGLGHIVTGTDNHPRTATAVAI